MIAARRAPEPYAPPILVRSYRRGGRSWAVINCEQLRAREQRESVAHVIAWELVLPVFLAVALVFGSLHWMVR